MAILKEGEVGLPVAQILRKHGIGHATIYKWKSKYGGASVAALSRVAEQRQLPRSITVDHGIEFTSRAMDQ